MENEYFVNHRDSTFVLGVEMHLKPFVTIGYRISESITENDDGLRIASACSFPALNCMENEYFVNHRYSTFVLCVEMYLKPFIGIGYRISESIRENDDSSRIAGVRSFLWLICMENKYFINHRYSTFMLGVKMHLKLFFSIGYRISESIKQNDDCTHISRVTFLPALISIENEYFINHRYSTFVPLGVEMYLKPFISIGYRISESIKENDDG
jgi:hypothetical protein